MYIININTILINFFPPPILQKLKNFWKNTKISYIIRQLCLLCTYQKLLWNETTIHIEAQKAHHYAFMVHKMTSNAVQANVEKNWKTMKKCACCHHIIKKVASCINVFRINFSWPLIHFKLLFLKKQFFVLKNSIFWFCWKTAVVRKVCKIRIWKKMR